MLQVDSQPVFGLHDRDTKTTDSVKRGNMKKLLAASVLALALVAGTQQQASAWSHFKFGVGMNIDWSCGDNNLLWGVYRCGPAPQNNGPLGGYYAPTPVPSAAPAPFYFGQPNSAPPTSAPAQYQGAPAGTQVASYPQNYYYQGNSYYPASNHQGASYYPMSYYPGASSYYPMSYNYGYPPGFSFYGN
jgi:hypothetical protein